MQNARTSRIGHGLGCVRTGSLLAATLAWTGACGAETAPEEPLGGRTSATPAAALTAPARAHERAVHVRLTLEIDSGLAQTVAAVREAAQARGGYVEASSRGDGDEGSAELELRVPAAELDAVRAAIAERGTVTNELEDVEDVTFEHVDVEARLRSAREEERRLLMLLVDRTAALSDVLAVERELTRVRGEVERLDASERALADRVAMARVSLSVRWVGPPFERDPLGAIASAGRGGVRVAARVTLAVVVAAVGAAPTLGVALVLVALARRLLRLVRRVA